MNFLKNINILLAKLKKEDKQKYLNYRKEMLSDPFYQALQNEYDFIFGKGKTRKYLKEKIVLDFDNIILDSEHTDNLKNINSFLYESYVDFGSYKILNNLDYIEGYATNIFAKNKKVKIGKLLNNLSKKVAKEEAGNISFIYRDAKTDKIFRKNINVNSINEILKIFNQRPSKENLKKNFIAVISRSVEDIAGMSTDRRWTSCMRLPGYTDEKGGSYHGKLQYDIKYGTLVAYLIEEKDKNIEDPIARISIKPFKNATLEENNLILLIPEKRIYSDGTLTETTLDNFKNIIFDFFDDINKDKEGIFKFNNLLYNDSGTNSTIIKVDMENNKEFKKLYDFALKKFDASISKENILRTKIALYILFSKDKNHPIINVLKNESFNDIYSIEENEIVAGSASKDFYGSPDTVFSIAICENLKFSTGILYFKKLHNVIIDGEKTHVKRRPFGVKDDKVIFKNTTFLNGFLKCWDIDYENWVTNNNKWVKGYIYSNKFNYFIFSLKNPTEFLEYEKKSSTIEELESYLR